MISCICMISCCQDRYYDAQPRQPSIDGGMERTGGVLSVVGSPDKSAPGGYKAAEFDVLSGAPLNMEAHNIASARGGGDDDAAAGRVSDMTSVSGTAEQEPGTPPDRAPSSRQGFSSAQSAGLRSQGAQALVGARVRVFVSGAEGRVGVVTGIVKAFGGSSKHMIFFDGASKPENVLLQKSTDGRGVRFHVLEQGGSQFRSQSS